MCGRYSLDPRAFSQIRLPFDLKLPEFEPRYNIAPASVPGYEVPIIRVRPRLSPGAPPEAEVVFARWWFFPPQFAGRLEGLPTTFNARCEDLANKPTWRESFAHGRCLVPATGWREFRGPRGHKRAFQFVAGEAFLFAGLATRWQSMDGEVVDSFAIITAEANAIAEPVHDRMPVVVPEALTEAWLTKDSERQQTLDASIAAQAERMRVFEVSSYGNSVRVEGPECVAPIDDAGTEESTDDDGQGRLF